MLPSDIRIKMEKAVDEKLDSLAMYVPFINYLLELDNEKYRKFKDIQHWIISRKRYPMNVLQKIEQSIITQYRNLFFDDGKVPKHIMDIFNTHAHVKCFSVNLCSDDEDNAENSSDIKEDDDDVIIVSTSPNTQDNVQPPTENPNQFFKSNDEEILSTTQCSKNKEQEVSFKHALEPEQNQCVKSNDEETSSATHCSKTTELEVFSKPSLEPSIIDEPICLDSDEEVLDDEVLMNTVPNEGELCVKEEQLFKRRGDFIDKVEEKEESEAFVQTKANYSNELSNVWRKPIEVAQLHQMQETDLNLENMNMNTDRWKHICEDLTKEIGIDVQQMLKSINLTSSQTGKNKNKSPNEDFYSSPNCTNKSPYEEFNTSPQYTNTGVPLTPYPVVNANVVPPNIYSMQTPILPQQTPLRLNLKDPRIVKLLEKSNTLQMISMGMPVRNVTTTTELPKSEPKTYGDYKRQKAERAKKAEELRRREEANKAEELKRIEEAKSAEALRKIEEAKRSEELRRIEETKKAEELKRIEKEKRAEELKRIEAAKRSEELRRIEETKKAEELKRIEKENSKRAEELKRIGIAKRAEELKRIEEAKKAEELKIIEEAKRAEELNRIEDAKKAEELKRIEEAKRVEKLKSIETEKRAEELKITEKAKRAEELKRMDEINMDTEMSSVNNQLDSFGRQQTDFRSIILNTILPYSDKILNVLKKDNDLQELTDKIAALGNSKKESDKKTGTNTTTGSHQISSFAVAAVNMSNQNTESANNVQNDVEEQTKCELYSKCTQKSNKRRQKENKSKPAYKRIRSISSSSSSSSTTSESSFMTSPTTPPSTSSTTTTTSKTARENQPLVCEPIIKLRRLSAETISKYTKTPVSESKTINIRLVEDVKRTMKTVHHLVKEKPIKLNVKYKNIDIHMTNNNTKFCVLCKSKPSDLTNHYKRVHKIESYVARLSRSAVQYLENNISFAQKLAKNTSQNVKKYKIKCAFCQDEIEDKFINFYKHFSIHTGEYAFQCDVCKLEKPYEFDIQSHKCHSKSCRNAAIRTLYQYPPNVLVIYLYCCKICNFVQLNEANTFKHLRDHHDKRQDDSSCITKYILTAINDEETCEKSAELETNYDLLMKDDDVEDIQVRNEAILEDITEKELVESNQLSGKQQDFKATISSGLGMVELPYTKYYKYSSVLNKNPTSVQQNDERPIVLSSVENFVNSSAAPCLEYIKTEYSDILPLQKENYSCKKLLQNSRKISYRQYPNGVSYFGLYKCMATDCLFSTDGKEEILQHLQEHLSSECPPKDCLLCGYCQLDAEICSTPEELIAHIQRNHQQSQFQCSVCCYRGISPSYVSEHFKHAHSEQELQFVYKCALDINLDTSVPENIAELLEENVEPLVCPLKDCVQSFHSVDWMKNHLMHAHFLLIKNESITALEKYACIYCTMNFFDLDKVKNHLATNHPDHQPYVCERVLLPGNEEDLLQNLTITFVSLPTIPAENIRHVKVKQESEKASNTTEVAIENQTECDTKPNLEQLVRTAEESVKLSLLKLIKNTGISPDLLYHCPQPTCGGFFSSYDLWYRHMSLRHCCLLSICPHCTNDKKTELPLLDFKEHFQQHCCHLYGCFHCGETFSNEQATRDHITLAHTNINTDSTTIQTAKVALYFNQSFNILLKSGQEKDRYTLLLELQEVIQNRCKYVEKLYYESLKTQWIVPVTATWLENFPSFRTNDRIKRKCFCRNCPFQTYDNELFYTHLRQTHQVNDNKFVCAKCDFHVACKNWDPIIDHIKMHVLNIHICSVCSFYHHDRQAIRAHLSQEHRFRDVPIVTLIRSSLNTQISIAIVFAQQRKTFSTINSCFCCDKSNSSWNALATHLKKTHHLTLQYFCEICDESLKLTECDVHFSNCHPTAALRVRCLIATNTQISMDSVMPLKLTIESNTNDALGVAIKQEPCDIDMDSDIELINDDDIVIANDMQMCETQKNPTVIRCVSVANLQRQHTTNGNFETLALPQSPLPVADPKPIRCVSVANLQSQHTNNGSFEMLTLPQPPLPVPVSIPQLQPQPMQQLQLQSQFIPQFVPQARHINPTKVTNAKTPLFTPPLAIHNKNPNFAGDYNYRPVEIVVNATAEKDGVARVSRGGKTPQYYREYRARKKAEREKEKFEMIAGSQTRKRKTAAEYQRARKKDSTSAISSISAGAPIITDESTISNSAGKDSAARVSRGGKTPQYYREYRARKKAEREKEKFEMIAGSQTKKRKTAGKYQRARKKDSTFTVSSISAGASITTDESTFVNSPITGGHSTRVDGLMAAGPPIDVDKINDSDNTHNSTDSRLCGAEKDGVARVSRGGKTPQYYREYRARKKAEREKEKFEMIAGSQTKKRKTAAKYQRARKKDSTSAISSISAGAPIITDESTIVNSPITA
ncbi:uncharacterized protein LOC105233358 isoform X3 [Bactrocera dorsalis]|uniref:Uncharacterized protein LOC105233358 isoform X3 n=1 Tax=Bactrocera dorsalis TaxID=27457 RepID=A0ABM3J0D0_BACDO|nr:uncharacterized protein LOC105233358 isoform X3 [Bactrocera dorsalis]